MKLAVSSAAASRGCHTGLLQDLAEVGIIRAIVPGSPPCTSVRVVGRRKLDPVVTPVTVKEESGNANGQFEIPGTALSQARQGRSRICTDVERIQAENLGENGGNGAVGRAVSPYGNADRIGLIQGFGQRGCSVRIPCPDAHIPGIDRDAVHPPCIAVEGDFLND